MIDILAAPWSLGPLTFGAPVVLWGALAAAGPVLIHLALRTRAQRVALPTVRFVLKTQQRTQSRQRLKHLLLLLLRTLAILLLVGALARPTLETGMLATATRKPVEAVFCVDDSASMGYHSRDATRFQRARQMLVKLLRDRSRFPPGSRAALLTGSAPTAAVRLSLDLDTLRVGAERLEVGQHGRGLDPMLRHAYALLDEGVLPGREIYVLTDVTQQAWRGVSPAAYADRKNVQVFCIDVGVDQDTNFALLDVEAPKRTIPRGSPAEVRFGLRAGSVDGRRSIEVLLDGKPRWRSGPVEVKKGSTIRRQVSLSDLAAGLHQGEVRLSPDDPLDVDNARYFSLHVGPLPAVAVVGHRNSQVAAIVSAMISPTGLPETRRRVRLSRLAMDELLGTKDLSVYSTILLADTPAIPQSAVTRLGGFVRAGGVLVVVPGPSFQVAGYVGSEAIMPAMPIEIATPAEPLHVIPSVRPHRLIAAFQGDSGLSLSDPAVRRFVRFGDPLAGGRVIARTDSDRAAIIVRDIGRGSSIALAFSPTRDWGDFAIDAGPMLVLLNTIVQDAAPGRSRSAQFLVGQLAEVVLSSFADSAGRGDKAKRSATITSPTLGESWPASVDAETGGLRAVTNRAGQYLVAVSSDDSRAEIGYSVNTPAGESDLRRASMASVASRFAPDLLQRVERLDTLETSGPAGSAIHALTGWLAIGLLGLLVVESLLSNRFYRRPDKEDAERSENPRAATTDDAP